MIQRLLAKSCADPDAPRRGESLQAHTAEVLAAARTLLLERADAALSCFGLNSHLRPRLERAVILAAGLHDLGKCNAHFQAMVRGRREQPQLFRHEALSALITRLPEMWAWLGARTPDPDLLLVIAAVAGHHRCFPDDAVRADAGDRTVLAHTDHPDFVATLRALGLALNLPPPPTLPPTPFALGRRGGVQQQLRSLALAVEDALAADPEAASLLPLVKALLISADVAGSAFPRAGARPAWIGEQLARRARPSAVRALCSAKLNGRPPRPFQTQVAETASSLCLVKAGCGTGKTLAAWMWAAHRAPRQIWFCYPTTGTATEGYRDYLLDAELDALLEHSRAAVDLDILNLRDAAEAERRDQDRLASLAAWGAPAISATVDTVLGIIRNQRKGLYAFPALSHAAVIFDELHAYDDRLFGALLRFLRATPGLPALMMTASLPDWRLALLEEVAAARGETLPVLSGPEFLETLPRYHRVEAEYPASLALSALSDGGKVLWVSNTVDRCRQSAESLANQGLRPLIYHSRFRYEDRVRRHADVIDAFRAPGPAVACTTQVAEMSLDLSADLLITEAAPVPALIQRLGRLNRRSTPENLVPPRPFVVVNPPSALPYAQAELLESAAWLARLGSGALSQRDLVRAWSQEKTHDATPPQDSDWLDGGPETRASHLREGGVTVTMLLASDRAAVLGGRPAQAVALPMTLPRGVERAWRSWPRLCGLPVVPDEWIDYDPMRGARWRV